MPVAEKLVLLLKVDSPVRWNVLFVDPCSPGYVPVASVNHPTPVFGGYAWTSPLSPLRPVAMRSAYVGITPSAAYPSMRSGRIPSEAKKIAFSVLGLVAAGDAPPTALLTA